MIVCKCPACSKAYKVRDDLAGKSAKCACGNRFTIPAAGETGASPEPPQTAAQIRTPEPVSKPAEPPAIPRIPAHESVRSPEVQPRQQPPVPEPRPQRAVAMEPVAAAAAPTAEANDEGSGGVGRVTFILALVFVTVIAAILGLMARHSGMGMRMVALVWLAISGVAMFVVTQARLLSIGYNEWFAVLLAAPVANIWLIGGCSVFPEGFKDAVRRDPAIKAGSGKFFAGAIAVGVLFYAVCLGFAYYLVYIA